MVFFGGGAALKCDFSSTWSTTFRLQDTDGGCIRKPLKKDLHDMHWLRGLQQNFFSHWGPHRGFWSLFRIFTLDFAPRLDTSSAFWPTATLKHWVWATLRPEMLTCTRTHNESKSSLSHTQFFLS
mmetsp:Transcript_133305/g.231235  ORF Transcript_133305/g.231235 Transcript_133305/m.231235 type:complete len:125 (+) Transcript_133305:1815-2189(+)